MELQTIKLSALPDKINSLSLRERVLLLATVLLVIFSFFDLLLLSTVRASYGDIDTDIASLQAEQKAKQAEIGIINQTLQQAYGESSLQALNLAEQAIKQKQQALVNYIDAVTPPEQLIPMLHEILHPAADFQLIKITVDKPQKVMDIAREEVINETFATSSNQSLDITSGINSGIASVIGTGVASNTEPSIAAYKQDIHLQLRGTYQSIVEYLSFLELSHWMLFWGGIDYVVDEYPIAEVNLHFYTMTTGVGIYGE